MLVLFLIGAVLAPAPTAIFAILVLALFCHDDTKDTTNNANDRKPLKVSEDAKANRCYTNRRIT
jgi:uncharacterized membrane protein YbaN (DUF454 family)